MTTDAKNLILCLTVDSVVYYSDNKLMRKILSGNMSAKDTLNLLKKEGPAKNFKKGDFFEVESAEEIGEHVLMVATGYRGDFVDDAACFYVVGKGNVRGLAAIVKEKCGVI